MKNTLAAMRSFIPLLVRQYWPSRSVLTRTPEPSALTDAQQNVVQYDQVMGSKLVMSYAAGLEAIFRSSPVAGGSAVDLACGPGHFTLCLAKYLGFHSVRGIDLAEPMVATASANAEKQRLAKQVQFSLSDATAVAAVADVSADVITFNNASHHMPDLRTVGSVLQEMLRIVKATGLIVVMDLVRLKSKPLTEQYVNTLGADYVERGLPDFLEDFRNSMYAAWTAPELASAVPRDSGRTWYQLVPSGLPTLQIIIGLPQGRKQLFIRQGTPWDATTNPVPKEMRGEYWLLWQSLFRFGSKKVIATP